MFSREKKNLRNLRMFSWRKQENFCPLGMFSWKKNQKNFGALGMFSKRNSRISVGYRRFREENREQFWGPRFFLRRLWRKSSSTEGFSRRKSLSAKDVFVKFYWEHFTYACSLTVQYQHTFFILLSQNLCWCHLCWLSSAGRILPLFADEWNSLSQGRATLC